MSNRSTLDQILETARRQADTNPHGKAIRDAGFAAALDRVIVDIARNVAQYARTLEVDTNAEHARREAVKATILQHMTVGTFDDARGIDAVIQAVLE